MTIDDVSSKLFPERFEHFIGQFTIDGQSPDDVALKLARKAASEEMMDEQHVMLRAICLKLGIPIPND